MYIKHFWSQYKSTGRTLCTYAIKGIGLISNSFIWGAQFCTERKRWLNFKVKETKMLGRRCSQYVRFEKENESFLLVSLLYMNYLLLSVFLVLNTSLLVHVTVPKNSSSTLKNAILSPALSKIILKGYFSQKWYKEDLLIPNTWAVYHFCVCILYMIKSVMAYMSSAGRLHLLKEDIKKIKCLSFIMLFRGCSCLLSLPNTV